MIFSENWYPLFRIMLWSHCVIASVSEAIQLACAVR
jgi:hypothetical protein